MAENSKLKVLYVLEIMKKTDEQHPLNTTQIAKQLADYGVLAERKSITRDLECLEDAGYSIVKCENHNQGWYMADQEFEDYELKMLVDAVSSARFLTLGDSRNLIRKIKKLATKEGENLINSTMVLDPSIKIADNKFKLKYDMIMRAISDGKKISFQYFEYTRGNQKVLKKNGYLYRISPYYTVLYADEYFVLGNPVTHDHATHFKIEMMTNVEVLEEPVRSMNEIIELKEIGTTMTIGDYLRANVNMWTGVTTSVRLHCNNSFRHDLMMKFGKDVIMLDKENDSFVARVNVTDNQGFYQWLASCGTNVILEEPQDMKKSYAEYLNHIAENYK